MISIIVRGSRRCLNLESCPHNAENQKLTVLLLTAAVSKSREITALMTAVSLSMALDKRLAVDMCSLVGLKCRGVSSGITTCWTGTIQDPDLENICPNPFLPKTVSKLCCRQEVVLKTESNMANLI